MVKGILISCYMNDPFFPVKCEMACFFLVSSDFVSSR